MINFITRSQRDLREDLMSQLGYDEDDFNVRLDTLTREEASLLIRELIKERG